VPLTSWVARHCGGAGRSPRPKDASSLRAQREYHRVAKLWCVRRVSSPKPCDNLVQQSVHFDTPLRNVFALASRRRESSRQPVVYQNLRIRSDGGSFVRTSRVTGNFHLLRIVLGAELHQLSPAREGRLAAFIRRRVRHGYRRQWPPALNFPTYPNVEGQRVNWAPVTTWPASLVVKLMITSNCFNT
jgi:hypothetical protein